MKTILLTLAMCITLLCNAQITTPVVLPQSEWKQFFSSKKLSLKTWDYGKTGKVAGLSVLQGLSNGIHEAFYRSPDEAMRNNSFLRRNAHFFDQRESWKNKYGTTDGIVDTNKEAFPLSTSVLISLTDHHHFDRNLLLQAENLKTTIIFVTGEKPNWSEWLINTAVGNIVRGAVTHLVIESLR